MWTVKQLSKKDAQKKRVEKQYYRVGINGQQLGDLMTLDEIVAYCLARPTDKFARNFLQFINYVEGGRK